MRLQVHLMRPSVVWLGSLVALIAGSLLAASPASGVAGFGDVAEDSYFTEAVQWSVDNGITGIDGNCFLPDAAVTRGEAAVYIWNMEGQPTAPPHSFVDIADESQNAAVSWMLAREITTGTSEITFAPDTTLTRAHLVTFLHRLAGEPSAPPHQFVDVRRPWQQAGVSWASDTGITTGTSPTTFEPDTTLTRAHLVTFLWRYQGKPPVTIDPTTPLCDPTVTAELSESGTGPFVAVSAGSSSSCGINSDRTITCWGGNTDGDANAPVGQFKAVSTGSGHSCALRVDSTIACWGDNYYGETDPPDGEFIAVAAGAGHSCGVRTEGEIECWGWNDNGQSDPPEGEFTTVSAGYWHTCAVRRSGALHCWGSNFNGQTDAAEGRFISVSATQHHSCGLRTDGRIACWGDYDHSGTRGNAGALANAPAGEFISVSAGDLRSCGVRTSGTVECWGFNNDPHLGVVGQLEPPAGKFSAVAAGFSHACGLHTNGAIECWGRNEFGAADGPSVDLIQAVYVVPPDIAPSEDQADGPSVDLIQAVYVVPADKTPVEGQTSAIRHEIDVVQAWYAAQTGGTYPVFTRDGDSISVATVNLSGPLTEFDTVAKILVEVRGALDVAIRQPLVLYVEGRLPPTGEVTACGWASNHVVIPIENCDIRPLQGSVWPYGATYLLAHELAHILGGVPECAPNRGFDSHVIDDPRDLLYQGPEPRDWDNLMLDPGNDDYFMHGRDDCLDIADSPLLGSEWSGAANASLVFWLVVGF